MDDDRNLGAADTVLMRNEGAADRARAEAEVRRAERDLTGASKPTEIDGRGGPEPVRYGDWEKNGIACDF